VVGGGTPVLAQWLLNSTKSITGVAIASAIYALVSLVCMIGLLNRTGFLAGELSTAEQEDVNDLERDTCFSPLDERKTVPVA